jgi:non-ribosomal peptide synthetase component E (peptide arylation enzyme)
VAGGVEAGFPATGLNPNQKAQMQIANGKVTTSPEFTHVTQGITPAEALIIKKMHNQYSNGAPLRDLVVVGEATEVDQYGKPLLIQTTKTVPKKITVKVKGKDVEVDSEESVTEYTPSTKPRTNTEEANRLRRKYTGNVTVDGGRTVPAFQATFGDATIPNFPQTFEEIREIIGNVFTNPQTN